MKDWQYQLSSGTILKRIGKPEVNYTRLDRQEEELDAVLSDIDSEIHALAAQIQAYEKIIQDLRWWQRLAKKQTGEE